MKIVLLREKIKLFIGEREREREKKKVSPAASRRTVGPVDLVGRSVYSVGIKKRHGLTLVNTQWVFLTGDSGAEVLKIRNFD